MSHAARGYTGLAALGVMSTRAYLQLLSGVSSRRVRALYVASTVGCVYFNLYGVWLIIVQYTMWLAQLIRGELSRAALRQLWWSFLAVMAGVVLLYAPLGQRLLQVAMTRGRTAIVWSFPGALFAAIFGVRRVWEYVPVALLLIAGGWRLRRRPVFETYLVALLLVPLIAAWLIARPQDLFPRLFHFWSPFAAILLAAAVTVPDARPRRVRRLGQGAAIVAVLLVAGVWLRRDLFAAPDGGYRSFLVRQMAGEPAGIPTLLAGPDADIVSFYLHRPATILTSSLALERRLRSEPSAFVLVFHHPGWETPEERRIQELAVRRCRPSDDALVSIYRCGE